MADRPSSGSAWIALLDARQGRLLEATRTDRGSLHLEERDRLDEEWEEKEHLRQAPSVYPDRGSHTDTRKLEL